MSITGIESSMAGETAKSAVSGKKLAENFDTFLIMLTTQLKHQDPLSPMDSTEFTNQLVQFANVEQQIAANANLETLIGVNAMSQKAWSISYIGSTIEAESASVPLQGSKESNTNEIQHVGGTANFSYTLPQAAKSVKIEIKDANGNVVRSFSGSTAVGRHADNWDGNDASGQAAPNGKYTVNVTALDTAGNAITPTIGVVTQPGRANFSYTLASDARSAAIVIRDGDGNIVRNLAARGEAGRHEMSWDGKDKDGRMLPDGAYSLEVVALDGEGKSIESATTVYGRVTDVSADGNETLLNMSGVVTTLNRVLTVRDPAAMANAN